MTLNDLEPPKNGVLVSFFSQFLAAAHIPTVNCDEMAGDRPRQPAYEIFSIKRSPDPLGLRRPAQAGVKDSNSPKKWLICRYWLM